jgi:hypothetical protein
METTTKLHRMADAASLSKTEMRPGIAKSEKYN